MTAPHRRHPRGAGVRGGHALLAGLLLLAACATPPAVAPTAVPVAAAAPAAPAVPAASAASAALAGPAAPAAGARYAVANPGFESAAVDRKGDPEGWYSFQHAGDRSYRFALDGDRPRSGRRSLRIDNVGPEPYGAIAQVVDARPHRGKVARLSGWLRTRDAGDGGAGLTLLVLAGGATLDQNFMFDAPVNGTTEWKRYTIAVPIHRNADRLEIGAMLRGRGTLWLDDVELEIVAAN